MRVWTTKDKSCANLLASELHPRFGAVVQAFVNPNNDEPVYTVKSKTNVYMDNDMDNFFRMAI